MTTKHISKTIGDDADADAGGFQQHKSLSEEPTQQILNSVWVDSIQGVQYLGRNDNCGTNIKHYVGRKECGQNALGK